MTQTYDVVVIGAGSGGLTAAVGAAKIGKTVLLIEREHMGGECTNSGCIPSKALLHHAKAFAHATQVAGRSPQTEQFRADAFAYVRQKIDEVLAEETPETFEQMGITVLSGEAAFVSRCALQVNGTEYRYKRAIIATGSQPRTLDVPGLAEASVLTNQNLFALEAVPERTLIIGAGPIGLEMSHAFALLGSQVTLATIDATIAPHEDEAIQPLVTERLRELGVNMLTGAQLTEVVDDSAHFKLTDDTEHETAIAAFATILLAIGRVPNLPAGLAQAGIQYDERCILVDSQYRSSNKYVFAVGDVAQRLKFTHTADDAARQVITRIASKGWLRVNRNKAVPKVTYTEPEMAQVGLSWAEAETIYRPEQLMRIEVPVRENDRAKTEDVRVGQLVVIARRLNGAVLGAHIYGPRAGELIAPFTLAIDHKLSLWQLRRSIYAYPTYSLLIKKAGDVFLAQQLASLKTDIGNLCKRNLPKITAAIFWAVLIYSFQHYRLSHQLSYQDMLLQLLDFFTTTMWGPFVYMLLYAIRPLVFFPATLLTALSGALFGFWWGIFYTVIGENASANFAYWIGRYFGKDLRLEDTVIGNWVNALRQNSFETVLLMRLFYVPFDLTNYGAGVVKAKWREYFLATLIGIMPGLTTFVALGAALDLETFRMNGLTFDAFDPKYLALSAVIFIVSLTLSRFLKRWRAEA